MQECISFLNIDYEINTELKSEIKKRRQNKCINKSYQN